MNWNGWESLRKVGSAHYTEVHDHLYSSDFRRRFLSLLSYKFREFGSVTALSVLESVNIGLKKSQQENSRGMIRFPLILNRNSLTWK